MRLRQPIIKALSVIMILVMMQKIAGGLYLHNWLHIPKNVATVAHSDKIIGQYNCSCIDDFYVPFTEAQTFSVQTPFTIQENYFVNAVNQLPVVGKHFHSLRGPPAA
ncbi:MAG: hypothetical protein QM764_04400 [Chitinophagaceae bacterium]